MQGRRRRCCRCSRKPPARARIHVPYESAAAYLSIDDTERAISLLNEAVEKRSNCLMFLRNDPRLKVLRQDPRYEVLLTRVGLDDVALASYKR